MKRQGTAGFTLIETLVALAVLALGAMAFLGATEAYLSRIGALEARVTAMVVAQSALAEVGLGLEPRGEVEALGLPLAVRADRSLLPDAGLQRVDIAVAGRADGRVYARLTGFVPSQPSQVGP